MRAKNNKWGWYNCANPILITPFANIFYEDKNADEPRILHINLQTAVQKNTPKPDKTIAKGSNKVHAGAKIPLTTGL